MDLFKAGKKNAAAFSRPLPGVVDVNAHISERGITRRAFVWRVNDVGIVVHKINTENRSI
jgi:hypothetical protein